MVLFLNYLALVFCWWFWYLFSLFVVLIMAYWEGERESLHFKKEKAGHIFPFHLKYFLVSARLSKVRKRRNLPEELEWDSDSR